MTLPIPVYRRLGSDDPAAPMVVLLHGRGADETSMLPLVDRLPTGPQYVLLRAPLPAGDGWTWFENRGLGRPVPESLAGTIAWFRAWLDSVAVPECLVVPVGFSGGAAFAGGVVLSDPSRFRGLAMICGTLPWDAGVPIEAGALAGLDAFCAVAEQDEVMPAELMDRTRAYFEQDTGARRVTLHRDPGGHEISEATARLLATWLEVGLSGC